MKRDGVRVLLREEDGSWIDFRRPSSVIEVWCIADLRPALDAVEHAVNRRNLYAAGWVAYEAAPAFDARMTVRKDGSFPLLWFGLFDAPTVYARLPPPSSSSGWPPAEQWTPSVSEAAYRRAYSRVKEWIRAGDTYQVNYSYRLTAPWTSPAGDFFLQMAAAWAPRYGALVDTGAWMICSASPELFFRRDGDYIESRPMKGTAARGRWYGEDRQQAAALGASEKERAENLMIVDMVRNDVGRIALPGSVRVPRLFTVEQHPTVWQMTSTVTARTAAPLGEIFQALFPAASITGAPKVRSMEIIAALESAPRRIYCGCIGVVRPGRKASFNVAIRTLLANPRQGLAEFGVGGGIVWDSRRKGEWNECRVKAAVLRRPPPPFDLLETMRWTPARGFVLLRGHFLRLKRSAAYFGFSFDIAAARETLIRAAAAWDRRPRRVRLLVSRRGGMALEEEPWVPPYPLFPPLTLAAHPVDSSQPLLYHKTTSRDLYREAAGAPLPAGGVLLFNERREITEASYANLMIRSGGSWWTPPVRCGLLPGVRRAEMLRRGVLRERVFSVDEALQAESLVLLNALRGTGPVSLLR